MRSALAPPIVDLPRDPDFAVKAGRVLDLYTRTWQSECSAMTTTSSPPMRRPPCRPAAGVIRVCHPDWPGSCGSTSNTTGVAYLAAYDVHQARVFGRTEPTTGIVPFANLVAQVMGVSPTPAPAGFSPITDHGSSHRGQKALDRLNKAWPNAHLVHTPVHASWVNQVEIYFSIVQRKVVTPNDFYDLNELTNRLTAFEEVVQPSCPALQLALHQSRPRYHPQTHRRPRNRHHLPPGINAEDHIVPGSYGDDTTLQLAVG